MRMTWNNSMETVHGKEEEGSSSGSTFVDVGLCRRGRRGRGVRRGGGGGGGRRRRRNVRPPSSPSPRSLSVLLSLSLFVLTATLFLSMRGNLWPSATTTMTMVSAEDEGADSGSSSSDSGGMTEDYLASQAADSGGGGGGGGGGHSGSTVDVIVTPANAEPEGDRRSERRRRRRRSLAHHRNVVLLAGGQIVPVVTKFATVSADDIRDVWGALTQNVHPGDLLLLVLLGCFTVRICGVLFRLATRAMKEVEEAAENAAATPEKATEKAKAAAAYSRYKKDDGDFSNHSEISLSRSESSSSLELPPDCFERSYWYQIASHVQQASRLAIVVYVTDCVAVVLSALGFESVILSHLSTVLAKVLFIGWAAQRLSVFKRYLLGRAVSRKPTKLGRISTLDRLLDGIICGGTVLFLLDILQVEMGIAVTSMFAFGSAGTLVVGLASRDLATMFVNGLTLSTSDRITEGDNIKFGDGTSGIVQKVGWIQTTIRNYDNMVVVVPNSELGMQRVWNISRIDMCQVKVNIRLRYDDADRIEETCAAILDEIESSCPKVVTDGSRPFRANWTDFKENYLEVVVNTHYNIPPVGTEYADNRQQVMRAIHRAVKKTGAQFVTSVYPYGNH